MDNVAAENVFENLNAQFSGQTEERGVEGIFATPGFEAWLTRPQI